MEHCKTQEEELTKNIKKVFEGTTPELQENISKSLLHPLNDTCIFCAFKYAYYTEFCLLLKKFKLPLF